MDIEINNEVKCINDLSLKGNDKSPEVYEGTKYKVINIIKCNCGEEHFDIGLISTLNYITCYKCRQELPNGPHWAHSSRFI